MKTNLKTSSSFWFSVDCEDAIDMLVVVVVVFRFEGFCSTAACVGVGRAIVNCTTSSSSFESRLCTIVFGELEIRPRLLKLECVSDGDNSSSSGSSGSSTSSSSSTRSGKSSSIKAILK